MLMPGCLLICQSVTQWSNCTICSTLACVSGSVTWGGWLGRARSLVLLVLSFNLLHQANTAVCCKQLSLYTCFIQEWMSIGLAPSAHTVEDAALCVPGRIHDCPPLSIRLFFREVTQSSLLMTCAYLGQQWQLSDGTRLITLHITCQYVLSAYLSDNPYIRRNFLVRTDHPAHDEQISAFAAEMQLLEWEINIVTACCSEVQNVWNFIS